MEGLIGGDKEVIAQVANMADDAARRGSVSTQSSSRNSVATSVGATSIKGDSAPHLSTLSSVLERSKMEGEESDVAVDAAALPASPPAAGSSKGRLAHLLKRIINDAPAGSTGAVMAAAAAEASEDVGDVLAEGEAAQLRALLLEKERREQLQRSLTTTSSSHGGSAASSRRGSATGSVAAAAKAVASPRAALSSARHPRSNLPHEAAESGEGPPGAAASAVAAAVAAAGRSKLENSPSHRMLISEFKVRAGDRDG